MEWKELNKDMNWELNIEQYWIQIARTTPGALLFSTNIPTQSIESMHGWMDTQTTDIEEAKKFAVDKILDDIKDEVKDKYNKIFMLLSIEELLLGEDEDEN